VLMMEENVLICPATPTDTVNVALISINSRPRRVPGGSIGAEESTIDRRVVLLSTSDPLLGIAYTFLIIDFIKIEWNFERQWNHEFITF
jgi:hypothetical protein